MKKTKLPVTASAVGLNVVIGLVVCVLMTLNAAIADTNKSGDYFFGLFHTTEKRYFIGMALFWGVTTLPWIVRWNRLRRGKPEAEAKGTA
jgi:hypothetical protein